MNRKLRRLTAEGNIPNRYRDCFASMDGKRFEICRPHIQQQSAYNTYYGYHNLGVQAVTAPDGMILEASGPYAGSNNDLNMLQYSNTLTNIAQHLPDEQPYNLIADKIYNIHINGLVSLRQFPTELQEIEERAAIRIRIPVEWGFGKVVSLFPFLDFEKNLKIYEREVGVYIIVGVLMTNIHTTLYGSVCSNYFSDGSLSPIAPPSLRSYMNIDIL